MRQIAKLAIGVFVATILLFGTKAEARSQVEARYSREYNTCMSTAPGGTLSINECIDTELERQDARLNQAYKMVMTRKSVSQKTSLQESERQWIRLRDARCWRAAASEEGGSIGGTLRLDCLLSETVKRTMWLEKYK